MIIIEINNQASLYLLDRLPTPILRQIKAQLTFPNPAYQEAQKRGFWMGNLDREIKGYRMEGDALIIPRGATRQVVGILKAAGARFQVEDRRRPLAPARKSAYDEVALAGKG